MTVTIQVGHAHNSEAFVGPAPDREGYVFSHWEKGGQNIGTDQAGVTVAVDAPFGVIAVYTVSATNRAPTITDSSPSSPVSLTTVSNQTFSARATDPDDNISEWEWYVGDVSQGGQSLALTGDITRTFSYTFATPGEYTVRVTFTDDDGLSASVYGRSPTFRYGQCDGRLHPIGTHGHGGRHRPYSAP